MGERRRVAPEPWEPIRFELTDPKVAAIKALARGTASQSQQLLAFETIMVDFCGTRDLSFRPGDQSGDRATAFAEGRRFVGLQIYKTAVLHAIAPTTRGPEPAEPKSTVADDAADQQSKAE